MDPTHEHSTRSDHQARVVELSQVVLDDSETPRLRPRLSEQQQEEREREQEEQQRQRVRFGDAEAPEEVRVHDNPVAHYANGECQLKRCTYTQTDA